MLCLCGIAGHCVVLHAFLTMIWHVVYGIVWAASAVQDLAATDIADIVC